MKEPLYRAIVDTTACRVAVRVNDCPIAKFNGSKSIKTSLKLNQWLQQGENEVVVQVEPLVGEDTIDLEKAVFSGRVVVGDMTEDSRTRSEPVLAEFALDTSAEEPPTSQEISAAFDVDTPFPAWLWMKSGRLPAADSIRSDVIQFITKAWTSLDAGNIDDALALQRDKNSEFAQSMFQKFTERQADARAELTKLVNDPDTQLRPIEPSEFVIEHVGAGRLLRVTDDRERPILRFAFSGSTMSARLPMFLTRNANNDLVWIR